MSPSETNEYVVRDERAKVVTVAPKGVVFRFLRDACPDGEYSVEGPGTNCTIIRRNGILYPSSGTVNGVSFDPRSLDECQDVFEGQ